MATTKVFATPLQLGEMRLRNRFAMSAMGSGLGDPSGAPNERLIRYLERRAQQLVALIIVEATAILPELRYTPRQPSLDADAFLPAWQELARRMHDAGALVAVQLQHPGRQTLDVTAGECVAPSPIPLRVAPRMPRALSTGQIGEIVQHFGRAAARARAAGLDAVELHAGHGYLFTQFLSPLANHRDDAYGGSLANRFRFLREVVSAIHEQAGSDYPLLVRLSIEEYVEGGIMPDESLEVAGWLQQLGVSALRVSGGSNDQRLPVMIAPTDAPLGLFWEHSKLVRERVGIPVDAVGRIQSPEVAERLLLEGYADFISLGRPLLADPAFVRKAIDGETRAIRPCIACNQGCIDRVLDPRIGVISCLVNAEVGREQEELMSGIPERSRRVLVVGGGPAGMEAARVARQRGHSVTLCERDSHLGGEFRVAALPPGKQDYAPLLQYFPSELERLGVDVRLNWVVDRQTIEELSPEVVIWAVGADRRTPIEQAGVTASSVEELFAMPLAGHHDAVVLGTSWEGAEAALYLAWHGIRVQCLDTATHFGSRLSPVTRRWYLRQRLERAGVRICVAVSEVMVVDATAQWRSENTACHALCDLLVYEGVRVSRPVPELPPTTQHFVVGDALRPAGAFEAIHAGFEAALAIR